MLLLRIILGAHLTQSTARPDQIIPLNQPHILAWANWAPVTVGAGGSCLPARHRQPVTRQWGRAPAKHAPRPPVTLGLGPETDSKM